MLKYKGLALTILASSILVSACGQNEKSAFDSKLTKTETIQVITDNLKNNEIEIEIETLEETEIPSLYKLTAKNHPDAYVSKDGNYIIGAPILNISKKGIYEIGEKQKEAENKKQLAAIDKSEIITFPATGEAKHSIYVFTDATCAFCKKFHGLVPELNKAGIEINYIAWPRAEESKPIMENIWCSKDKNSAYTKAINNEKLSDEKCESPINKHFELGLKMDVRGTPAIMSAEGIRLGGFTSSKELIERLDNLKNPENIKTANPASEPKAE